MDPPNHNRDGLAQNVSKAGHWLNQGTRKAPSMQSGVSGIRGSSPVVHVTMRQRAICELGLVANEYDRGDVLTLDVCP